jgi:hypothetical protein
MMSITSRSRPTIFLCALLLVPSACGAGGPPPESTTGGGSGASTTPVPQKSPTPDAGECGEQSSGEDPEDTVSYVPCPGEGGPGRPSAEPAEPQPGQADVHPVAWDRAKPNGDVVRVFYWSGVEPCNVLDHVRVRETSSEVTITLFEGRTKTEEDVACIEVALLKYTDVRLDSPVGDRTIEDGAPGA